eukprot:TRINITY_DN47447_c0_g1_i1.p1 TRINITY_DN47447_c0_g1~~TRINITY_DN47447_c0_g1_i1.p1  ORF type:complete len:652 (+),score=71.61 TRINITY_DN47447_c0_g1_i1:35-1990(+)
MASCNEVRWFRKSAEELACIFEDCDWSWTQVSAAITKIRDGDHCEARSIKQGWEFYTQRVGSRSPACAADLCAHLAQRAVHAAKTLSPPSDATVQNEGWKVLTSDVFDLLSSAFWGNLLDPMASRKENRNRGGLSFSRIYDGYGAVASEKWACLWNYFVLAARDIHEVELIHFELSVGVGSAAFQDFAFNAQEYSELNVNVHTGGMEEVPCDAVMNFANKNFGYGKVIDSATQEEVLLMQFPEVNVGMLIFGQMADNEVVIVHNVRRFSYFSPKGFAGPVDSKERLKVLAADASLSDHFSEANNIRDLQKSYLAFQHVSHSVSSGRWGCGAFGGDVEHKLLQQIISARLARLQQMHFSTYHDEPLQATCSELVGLCTERSLSELLTALWEYSQIVRVDRPPLSIKKPQISVVQYLQLAFPNGGTRCMLLAHGSFNPVHRHHIEMIVAAKAAAEQAGFVVVKVVLACTAQEYLEHKNVDRVLQSTRMQALEAAIRPYNWLEVDARGGNYASGSSMLHQVLLPELRGINGGVVGFNVIGADAAGEPRKHSLPCIYVDRGSACSLKDKILEVNRERDVPHLHVLALSGEEVSSTAVRRMLHARQQSAVSELCGSAVAEILWQALETDRLWEKPRSKWACGRRNSSREPLACLLM